MTQGSVSVYNKIVINSNRNYIVSVDNTMKYAVSDGIFNIVIFCGNGFIITHASTDLSFKRRSESVS